MEIADIFVVNKADREGADRTVAAIEALLSLQAYGDGDWRPPIVKTEATTGRGVAELLEAVDRFRAAPGIGRGERLRARAEFRLRELLAQRFLRHVERQVLGGREPRGRCRSHRGARRSIPTARRTRCSGPVWPPVRRRRRLPLPGNLGADRSIMRCHIDHIGIAVAGLEEALGFYRDALGLEIEAPEEVPSQRVRAHFVRCAGGAAASIELLEATAADSPIGRFLAKRGPGLHHVALAVPDIVAALAMLKARGVRLIDETPRPGAHGALVAFIHPSSTHGVLVELKQNADDSDRCTRRRPRADPALRRLPPPRRRRHVRRRAEDALGEARPGRRKQPDSAGDAAAAGPRRARRCSSMPASATRWMRESVEIYGIDRTRNLDHALADAGIAAADIDIVLASHLHFDHAGGFTAAGAGWPAGAAVPARALRGARGGMGGRDAPARAQPGQLPRRRTSCRWPTPAS